MSDEETFEPAKTLPSEKRQEVNEPAGELHAGAPEGIPSRKIGHREFEEIAKEIFAKYDELFRELAK